MLVLCLDMFSSGLLKSGLVGVFILLLVMV